MSRLSFSSPLIADEELEMKEKETETNEDQKKTALRDSPGDPDAVCTAKSKGSVSTEADSEDGASKKKSWRSLNLRKLFRFASVLDWLLMFVGALAAVAHGSSLPIMILFFGKVTNAFVGQFITSMVISNTSVNCSSPQVVMAIQNFSQQVECLGNDEFKSAIYYYVYWFIAIALMTFLATYLQVFTFQIACERQVRRMRLLYYRSVLRQEIAWFDTNPTGEIASRLSDDIEKVHSGIGEKLAALLESVTSFLAGFVIAFVSEWRLALFLLGFIPFLAVPAAALSKVLAKFVTEEQKQYATAGAVAEEVLSSIRTVVAFGGEDKEAKRYSSLTQSAKKLGVHKGLMNGLTIGAVFGIMFAMYGFAFWFSGYLLSVQLTIAGNILTTLFAVITGGFAMGQAAPFFEAFAIAAGSATEISDTIDREPLIDSNSDKGLLPDEFESSLELSGVSFSYPSRPDLKVMNNLSLQVKTGQTFALVGPSGCGKSTVVQLLLRFYDIDEGQVFVSGRDVRDLNIKWLRSHIGVVSQEPILFNTTIAENIRYGKEDASMEEIEAAAKKANAHDFISLFPDGYNTHVGERGVQMSGGQKQRIAIARALVKDPKILLLDEATSSLDSESEAIVQEALDKAREGRTTIMIAHRLSTIQNADVIASIEDGRVVEMGTHTELMERKGLYFELVTAQSYDADEAFAVTGRLWRDGMLKRLTSVESQDQNKSGLALPGKERMNFERQASSLSHTHSEKTKKELLEKQQKEWDRDIPSVSLLRVILYNAQEWWIILIGVLSAAGNGASFPVFAIIFGGALETFALPYDEVLGQTHIYAGFFLLLALVLFVTNFLKTFCFSVAGESLTARLRSVLFRAMLKQEVAWFDEERNSSGVLTTRLAADAAHVQGMTGVRIAMFLETAFAGVAGIVIAFYYSWVLSLLIAGIVPFLIIVNFINFFLIKKHAVIHKNSLERAGTLAVDSIENICTVAALCVEDKFYRLFYNETTVPFKKAKLSAVSHAVAFAISKSMTIGMYALLFWFGSYQVTLPPDHIAHITFYNMFLVFFALLFGAIVGVRASSFAPDYAKGKLAANRLFFLLDRVPVMDTSSAKGERPEKVVGEVKLREIDFSYPTRPDVKVLQDLNLAVQPGKTLALVGPSGCGKSTVVSLIERFYDPVAGSLKLDDSDIRDLNIPWLRSQIGIVSQEPVLFNDSIAGNIRYGANFREVSDEEVIEAAKAANIHSFIETLPQGYSTRVGAKGTQMSGGQKQRIAIARALVRDPKILLLDEATSALDTESERVVQEALDRAREGRTSIVIAHRLSTIYNADCIAVINSGGIVEKGTHSELMASKGLYYQMNRFQTAETAEEPSVA